MSEGTAMWTKFSDKLPPEGMEQVFLKWPNENSVTTSNREKKETWADYAVVVSQCPSLIWHPITYPAPPKEETQREKDIAAFKKRFPNAAYVAEPIMGNCFYVSDVWHAALAYERKEVAKELEKLAVVGRPREPFGAMSEDAYNLLRKRCGLEK